MAAKEESKGERETVYFAAEEWAEIDRERGEESRYGFIRGVVLEALAARAEERAKRLREKADR